MESIIDTCVLEFFLRRQQNPRVYASTLISSLKPPDDSVTVKITAVLRDLSNSLTRGNLEEDILDLLEILEKLQEDSVIMGSLKSAYCWTAVECTLRFMWPLDASEGLLSDALKRIWEKRIGLLKERKSFLVTRELLKWESDLNKAFYEPKMYQKIRESNIRYNAISHLNQLLKEQWALLGCSSLEIEARKRLLKRKDRNDEEQEHESSLDKGDIRVAKELKDCLVEIQRVLGSSTRQGQEDNNGGGDNSQGTSSSSGRVRPRLPTPEPLNVSPLKKVKPPLRPRRPTRFWRTEELDALREGVKQHGRSWKDIKNSNPLVFADRTEVDLKDKWRNLIR